MKRMGVWIGGALLVGLVGCSDQGLLTDPSFKKGGGGGGNGGGGGGNGGGAAWVDQNVVERVEGGRLDFFALRVVDSRDPASSVEVFRSSSSIEGHPRFDSSDSSIVFDWSGPASEGGSGKGIYRLGRGATAPALIASHNASLTGPAVSAGGDRIAYIDQNTSGGRDVFVVEVFPGGVVGIPVAVTDGGSNLYSLPDLSPSGDRVAATGPNNNIVVIELDPDQNGVLDLTTETNVTAGTMWADAVTIGAPRWSNAHGDRITFLPGDGDLWMVDFSEGGASVVCNMSQGVGGFVFAAFSGDDSSVVGATSSGDIHRHDLDWSAGGSCPTVTATAVVDTQVSVGKLKYKLRSADYLR